MLTHTDNLVYEFETNDVFEDFYEDNHLFDFSDYPQHSKFFELLNKILVKWKVSSIEKQLVSLLA